MSEKEAMIDDKEGFSRKAKPSPNGSALGLAGATIDYSSVAEHLDLRDRAKARDGTAFTSELQRRRHPFGSPPVNMSGN